MREIVTSANDRFSEARQARLSFLIKNNLFLRLFIVRFISNGTAFANKRAGHLFDKLPFLSGDATCYYLVVVITRE